MISRRDFVLGIPALGLGAAAFPRTLRATQAMQTFNGPMAAAQDVYQPVTLAPKANANRVLTDAQRDDLEHQIHCQCGCNLDVYTCRTTDFSCTVSPAMHADVLGLVSGGYSATEILAAFKSVYGEKVLMAPVKSGFNLLGYGLPFVALGTGAVVVAVLLKRWKERALVPQYVAPTTVTATDEEIARLDAALRNDG